MTNLANLGLAHSTHKVYQTSVNHISKCENAKTVNLQIPWGTKETFHYINYVLFDRNVKAKTCEMYLIGIRMHRLSKGYDVPALSPAIDLKF